MELDRRSVLKKLGIAGGAAALGGVGAGISLTGIAGASTHTTDLQISDVDVTSDAGELDWVAVQAAMKAKWDGFEEDVGYFRFFDIVEIAPNSNNPETYLIHDTGIVPSGGIGGGKSQGGNGWGGNGEWYSDEGKAGFVRVDIDWGIIQENRDHIYNGGYALPENPAPTSRLEEDTDGETNDTTVVLRKLVRFYSTDAPEANASYPELNNNGVPVNEFGEALTGPNPGASWGPEDAVAEGEFVVSVNNEQATTPSSGSSSGSGGSGPNEEP